MEWIIKPRAVPGTPDACIKHCNCFKGYYCKI